MDRRRYRLVPLISEEEIRCRVAELGAQISSDDRAKGLPLLVVGVLKGAWVFMADLVRRMDIPVECDFLEVASYGPGTERSAQVALLSDVRTPIARRDVLLVEDIVDTGYTLRWICDELVRRNPKSLEVCTLLDKPSRREIPCKMKYVGFMVPDRFVVGYGLDYEEGYRNLSYLAYIDFDAPVAQVG